MLLVGGSTYSQQLAKVITIVAHLAFKSLLPQRSPVPDPLPGGGSCHVTLDDDHHHHCSHDHHHDQDHDHDHHHCSHDRDHD